MEDGGRAGAGEGRRGGEEIRRREVEEAERMGSIPRLSSVKISSFTALLLRKDRRTTWTF